MMNSPTAPIPLPCPFCGVPPKISGYSTLMTCETNNCPPSKLWVEIEDWNRRAYPSAEAREAAREIVHFLCANESSFVSVSAWSGERCEQQLQAIILKHMGQPIPAEPLAEGEK